MKALPLSLLPAEAEAENELPAEAEVEAGDVQHPLTVAAPSSATGPTTRRQPDRPRPISAEWVERPGVGRDRSLTPNEVATLLRYRDVDAVRRLITADDDPLPGENVGSAAHPRYQVWERDVYAWRALRRVQPVEQEEEPSRALARTRTARTRHSPRPNPRTLRGQIRSLRVGNEPLSL